MNMLLLDDHALVRAALETVLRSLGSDVVVHAAASAAQARIVLSRQPAIDLALLDLDLPDADGLGLLAEWRRERPGMPVVIVSASADAADMVQALDAGARGFIPKSTSNEVLLQALRMVMAGGIYIPPMVLQGTRRAAHAVGSSMSVPDPSDPPTVREGVPSGVLEGGGRAALTGGWPSARVYGAETGTALGASTAKHGGLRLTPRQSEVLELLLQGKPNKLIARQLNLSVETVKDHVASLLRVLGVSSRTQAVLAVGQLRARPEPAYEGRGGLAEGRAAPPGAGRPHA